MEHATGRQKADRIDQHQVRLWHSFHRDTVLSMCALALLTVAAAGPQPRRPPRPAPSRH